jgi:hypothetical protein
LLYIGVRRFEKIGHKNQKITGIQIMKKKSI